MWEKEEDPPDNQHSMCIPTPRPPSNDSLHLRQVEVELINHPNLFRIKEEGDPVLRARVGICMSTGAGAWGWGCCC